ncbi:MAG: hypothetical protein WEC79_06870 [Thermomicrobiales bacterium]
MLYRLAAVPAAHTIMSVFEPLSALVFQRYSTPAEACTTTYMPASFPSLPQKRVPHLAAFVMLTSLCQDDIVAVLELARRP